MIPEFAQKSIIESFSSLAISITIIIIPIIIIFGVMRIILDRIEGAVLKMVKKNRKNSRKVK